MQCQWFYRVWNNLFLWTMLVFLGNLGNNAFGYFQIPHLFQWLGPLWEVLLTQLLRAAHPHLAPHHLTSLQALPLEVYLMTQTPVSTSIQFVLLLIAPVFICHCDRSTCVWIEFCLRQFCVILAHKEKGISNSRSWNDV